MEDGTPTNADERVERYAEGSDLGWVADALAERRDEVLGRWIEAVRAKPFHGGRRTGAVRDHIPDLYDALLELLRRAAPGPVSAGSPLDDEAVRITAEAHAHARVEQGLSPAEVLAEVRMLRQEVGRALRLGVPDVAPTSDVVGAELLVNDALDGASAIALEVLTQRIEQLREDFLATTVHEVRQPIATIRGRAQLARQLLGHVEPDLERVGANLDHVLGAADQLNVLVTTLVDASRAELGGLALEPTRADLAALLRETLDRLDPDVAARVRVEVAPGLDTAAELDRERIEQVLSNLVLNAAKYSPPDSPIPVRLCGDARRIELAVSDDGIGIPPEELPRVFERYGRASNAVREGIGGLGLGLYLCRGIIEAHGGTIRAVSVGQGAGTTMRVTLPRRAAAGVTDDTESG